MYYQQIKKKMFATTIHFSNLFLKKSITGNIFIMSSLSQIWDNMCDVDSLTRDDDDDSLSS